MIKVSLGHPEARPLRVAGDAGPAVQGYRHSPYPGVGEGVQDRGTHARLVHKEDGGHVPQGVRAHEGSHSIHYVRVLRAELEALQMPDRERDLRGASVTRLRA